MLRLPILMILALSLLWTACRKETIVVDENTVIQPPVKIETTLLEGLVRDEKGPISGADVSIYEGEKLLGKVRTDAEGRFNTQGLPVKLGATVTLYAQKDQFASAAKRFNTDKPSIKDLKIKLLAKENIQFPTAELANPGDDQLVKVSGYVTTADGKPAQASVLLLYDVKNNAQGFEAGGGSELETDEAGYYETLVPKDSAVIFSVRQWAGPGSFSQCMDFGFLNTADFTVGLFQFQNVGPFTTDTQLPTLSNANPLNRKVFFTGKLVDCNDVPVTDGYCDLTIEKSGFPPLIFKLEVDATGNFSFKYGLCDEFLEILSAKGYDRTSGKSTEPITLTNVKESVAFGSLKACN